MKIKMPKTKIIMKEKMKMANIVMDLIEQAEDIKRRKRCRR